MFNLQGSEIIVILLLALVVLGPEKLPDAIRKFTQTYSELKKMGTGFQSEIKSALDEPMREMRATADLIKDSVDPDKLQAESEAEAELQRAAEAEAERMAKIDEAASSAEAARQSGDESTTSAADARTGSEAEAHDDTDASTDGAQADNGPGGDSDSEVADERDAADVPAKPINQIALANARSSTDTTVARLADVDIDAVPSFEVPKAMSAEAPNSAPDEVSDSDEATAS